MLITGASAYHSLAMDGALTFDVSVSPSVTWWIYGSAFIYIMLFAGASAGNPPSWGGALTCDVDAPPSWASLAYGSAY